MNLYEYLMTADNDYDTYDTKFDVCITVCAGEYDEDEPYDHFCKALLSKIPVPQQSLETDPCLNWHSLIEENLEKFRLFSLRYWKAQYEEQDEFVYQWLMELHMFLAGYTVDSLYYEMCKLLSTIPDA